MYKEGLKLELANSELKIALISELAQDIWRECYASILEKKQIEYMLETLQSKESITHAIDAQEYKYYLILLEGVPVGYAATVVGNNKCFLSKLYVKSEYREKRIGTYVIEFINRRAYLKGLSHMWLTCNKNNTRAIEAYKRKGFEIVDENIADIGSGYIMDDYIMEKEVTPIS